MKNFCGKEVQFFQLLRTHSEIISASVAKVTYFVAAGLFFKWFSRIIFIVYFFQNESFWVGLVYLALYAYKTSFLGFVFLGKNLYFLFLGTLTGKFLLLLLKAHSVVFEKKYQCWSFLGYERNNFQWFCKIQFSVFGEEAWGTKIHDKKSMVFAWRKAKTFGQRFQTCNQRKCVENFPWYIVHPEKTWNNFFRTVFWKLSITFVLIAFNVSSRTFNFFSVVARKFLLAGVGNKAFCVSAGTIRWNFKKSSSKNFSSLLPMSLSLVSPKLYSMRPEGYSWENIVKKRYFFSFWWELAKESSSWGCLNVIQRVRLRRLRKYFCWKKNWNVSSESEKWAELFQLEFTQVHSMSSFERFGVKWFFWRRVYIGIKF